MRLNLAALVVSLLLSFACSKPDTREGAAGKKTLEIFVGSASKPPTEAAVLAFEKKAGVKVEAHYGGSGKMLSELKLAERGDVYFPGSSDYMELAKREGLVFAETEQRVVYLIPAINVQKGNPRGIRSLADLGKPGVRVGIARPDTVCVGLYAAEMLEAQRVASLVRPNIVTQTESCEKTAQILSMKAVDAILGWEVFEHWDPANIESIYPPPEQVTRIGYIPAAVAKATKNRELAEGFIAFLVSDEGRAIYKRWSYLTTVEEARKHATATTPIGGEWELPASWK